MPKKIESQVQVLVGPSTTQTPYLVSTQDGVWFTSILSVGDQVGTKADGTTPWRMVGIPDGLGAYDNGDGTITVLMNQELGATAGVVRENGQTGAFVSKLIIDKQTLEVTHAEDLDKDVYFFNRDQNTYVADVPFNGTAQFGRLCSADLAPVSAFFNAETGLGTTERIFLNGEEIGNEGRAFAHVVTGSEAGSAFELPALGRMSFENSLANGYTGDKTVVMVTDDSTPGEVYLYVGSKQASGSTIEKAGLTNGKLYGIAASFGDDTGPGAKSGTFSLVAQGNDGDVTDTSGTALNAARDAITQFGRPEDGAWDPSNPNRFYFITTGVPSSATSSGQPTRLWALDFVDVTHPELGGTITALVEGAIPNSDPNSPLPLMIDNMTVTDSGLVVMSEDPGNNVRLAKMWIYDPLADNGVDQISGLTELGQHDPARFSQPFGSNGTPAPGSTNGFGLDEESSGVIDVTSLLGQDQRLAFLLDTQAHYAIPGELVEGGQLQAMYVDLPNLGDTKFNGGNGADVFDGGFGDDALNGGRGDDQLLGNYGNDRINGGAGNDTLNGGVGDDRIDGGAGNDAIIGGSGNDQLFGAAGADNITGGLGDDTIRGGAGHDTIAGGFGHDALWGGAGKDTFFFASINQGSDTIADFKSGVDTIKIEVAVDPATVAFVGFVDGDASAGSGAAVFYDGATGVLSFREAGAASLVQVATLTDDPGLHKADILFV